MKDFWRKGDWTEEMSETLRTLYPFETNRVCSLRLGVSMRTIITRAKKMGLRKDIKSEDKMRQDYIKDNFNRMSYNDIALHLGISKVHVARLAASLGLTRSADERRKFCSLYRTRLVRQEKRRLIFGLEPISKIKIVTNRARICLRSRLKSMGYIPSGDDNVMFYPEQSLRSPSHETKGRKLGIRFMPLPERNIVY